MAIESNTPQQSIQSPVQQEEESAIERSLRPSAFDDFIGQDNVKKNLFVLIEAAKKREEAVEHILFHGNPGLGKTTLSNIIAKEMNANLRITSGPAIERAADLAAIITNLQEGDVLFIDEIHRLNKTVEEILYPAMEDYALDIVTGKGPAARTLRIDLPKFTVVGATTRMSLIAAPLRDRFGAQYTLEFYTDEHIQQILERSAGILGISADHDALMEIARRSRKTPRIANRLLKRVRDFAQVHHNDDITTVVAKEALNMLDIDPLGLQRMDRELLHAIMEKFNGGPVGLQTIAAAIAEERETIETVYEPFLIQLGFLQRTPRGRIVTQRAYEHLGMSIPTHLSTIQQHLEV